MKNKSKKIILACVVLCLLLFNIGMLLVVQMHKKELASTTHKLRYVENIESMFDVAKEATLSRFKYEQISIPNSYIYEGSDKNKLTPIISIINQPKLVLGFNQNMCRPCVEGIFTNVKEVFPDFDTNPNIICIADIEQRFKDDYYGMKVISFFRKEDYPLHIIDTNPYLFILDDDLCVKQLFISNAGAPELTKEYLKIIKERYLNI